MPETQNPFYNQGPGDIIRDAMEELGWQQSDLAEITGLTEKSINKIINNKQSITTETAVLLEKAFSTSAEMWLNLDAKYQIRKLKSQNSEKYKLAEKKALLRKYMPVAELKKKGWLLNDVSTEEGIKKECLILFGQEEIPVKEYEQEKKFVARQTKFDYQYTSWYCRTWFEYAKLNAKKFELKKEYKYKYNREKLVQIAENFCAYIKSENGVTQIIDDLTNCGVGFFVLRHLQKTYLDGAAFVINGKSFIVYTARYDRIDNFWFVLAHEISHILLHFDFLVKPILDNLESNAESTREAQADKNAAKMLNSAKIISLGKLYGRYLNAFRLEEISQKSGVSISVALGILQHEGIIDWRQFAKYREKVTDKIPTEFVMG